MTEASDDCLLAQFRAGDRSAFDALFHRYAARVHATSYRLTGNWEDAEDTLQEVFLRLARKADTIREGRALGSWIYSATVNCASDCRRRRRPMLSLDGDPGPASEVIAIESLRRQAEQDRAHEETQLLAQVEALIPNLPDRQATAFVLRGFQGLSHRTIGEVMGCSESAAKSHYSLACRRLREWTQAQAEREAARDAAAGTEESATDKK